MPNFLDHPLASVTDRCSHEALTARAELWIRDGLDRDTGDLMVMGANAIRDLRVYLDAVADEIEAQDLDGVKEIVIAAPSFANDAGVAEACWALGQRMRRENLCPHGGSTASHLEMACVEIRNLVSKVGILQDMVDTATLAEIREVAFEAVERPLPDAVSVATRTHRAPSLRM